MSEHKHRWCTRYVEIKGVSCASGLECHRCGAVLDSDAVEAIINEIMDRLDQPTIWTMKLERQMSDDNIYAGGKAVEWIETQRAKQRGGFKIPADLVPALREFLESGKAVQLAPVGWVCPRCGKIWAPDIKQCDCKPPQLPHTVVGPTETK